MIIFVVFLVLLTASPSLPWLIVFLFGIGLALGCDYPTAHLMISESTPSNLRGRLVLSAFGFQALGVLLGTAVGYVVLHNIPDIGAWRWMYATAIIPALLVTIGRFFVLESASWQLSRGRSRRPSRPRRPAAAPPALSAQRQARSQPPAPFAPWASLTPLCGSLRPEQPSGDDPGLGALVPAGSRDLRHRHLHPDHPRRLPRP
jgi:Arabinose efflux permease